LRLWDVTDGSCVIKIDDAHTDIIRCLKEASSSDATTDFFISGSYDCYVKVWKFNLEALSNKNKQETNALDTPSPSYSIMATFQHGYPVEALLLFKNNNFLLTAGGPEIKVWEVCRDGSLVHSIKSHMKTVTSKKFIL
jgi:U3 small nucleolar RNA-associated protein 15